jgi:hypothetical protein
MVIQEANNHASIYVVERRQVGARMMSKEQSKRVPRRWQGEERGRGEKKHRSV